MLSLCSVRLFKKTAMLSKLCPRSYYGVTRQKMIAIMQLVLYYGSKGIYLVDREVGEKEYKDL